MSNTFYVTKSPDDIQHYGVLGMKWGVRRYQNKDGSLTSSGRKHYNKAKSKLKKKSKNDVINDVSKMSDEELRNSVERLRLQQEYNRIFSEKSKSMGSRYAKDALSIAGSSLGTIESMSSIGASSALLSEQQRSSLRKVKAASKASSKALNKSQEWHSNKKMQFDLSNKSNQELQKEINRKRLENQYIEMTLGNKKRGTEYVKNIMANVAVVSGTAASIMALKRIIFGR